MSQLSEPLNAAHRKSDFSCGKELLDVYLHRQANQDVKRKLSACFVINDTETNLIKGYYTLSNNSIPSKQVPNQILKKLPKSYQSIPTTLLGRLAIDNKFQGQGVGKLILIDALKRSYELSKIIGSFDMESTDIVATLFVLPLTSISTKTDPETKTKTNR